MVVLRSKGFLLSCRRESGVIEDDTISGDFDNFPEGKVRELEIVVGKKKEIQKSIKDENQKFICCDLSLLQYGNLLVSPCFPVS